MNQVEPLTSNETRQTKRGGQIELSVPPKIDRPDPQGPEVGQERPSLVGALLKVGQPEFEARRIEATKERQDVRFTATNGASGHDVENPAAEPGHATAAMSAR
jgi:hypothetical protein